MTAFYVVRFKIKPGREAEFIEAHRKARVDFDGFKRFVLIKTGVRFYACWASGIVCKCWPQRDRK